MFVQRFDTAKLEEAYGIQCQKIYPISEHETGVVPQPFGSTYCEIEPQKSTAPHNHYDGETFYILDGKGRMQIAQQSREVSQGDVVLIPPFTIHTLTNLSETAKLKFVSVYWENRGRAFDDTPPKRIFLASAPPTPNGPLHLGHLSGPYVVTDILRRFYRMNGTDVTYVCGSDDNQSYVPAKGLKLGLTAQGVIDRFVPEIIAVQEQIGAKADFFLQPQGNAEYVAFVQSFVERLVSNGHLQPREAEVLYCNHCQAYLHEAFVKGGCPTCAKGTSGNGCEACGITNDCIDLTDPKCTQCDTIPVRRTMKKLYFPLAPWKEKLKTYFDKSSIPGPFQAFAYSLLETGLREISGTHPSPWGIPLPTSLLGEGLQGQVVYEWLEMAAGYVYMAEKLSGGKGYAHFLASPESRFQQAFGFDNSYFYLVFVPALLMAYDEKIEPPSAFVINFFYNLDEKKFSTSRNHAVWGKDFLQKVSPDVARYYLAATRPEESESNFSLRDCRTRVANVLEERWNGLAWSLDKLSASHQDTMPLASRSLTASQLAFLRRVEDSVSQATYHHRAESFSMNRLAKVLDSLVDDLLFKTQSALAIEKTTALKSTFATESALIFTAAKYLGLIATPMMPETGTALYKKWSGEAPHRWAVHVEMIPPGTKFNPHCLESDRFQKSISGLDELMETSTF